MLWLRAIVRSRERCVRGDEDKEGFLGSLLLERTEKARDIGVRCTCDMRDQVGFRFNLLLF